MTKRFIKNSTCLALTMLIAAIALTLPMLSACSSSDEATPGKDSSGMEQNRSRAPSEEDAKFLDLPENLLDLEDSNIGRGIRQQHNNEEAEDQSEIINAQNNSQSKQNQDIPSDPLLNVAVNEGDEHAKQIVENQRMWNLMENSDEAADYYSGLITKENAVKTTEATQYLTTVPATTVKKTVTTTAPPTTTAAVTTSTQPATTAPASSVTTTASAAASTGNYLLSISKPDPNYRGRSVQVQDRAVLEGLVSGEFGSDYVGACLVAQAIRDTMVSTGIYNTSQIAREWGYYASVHNNPTDAAKRAVAFVFDQGGSAVQHSVYYFYAAHRTYSPWHESQRFVVQYGGCRFFSRW